MKKSQHYRTYVKLKEINADFCKTWAPATILPRQYQNHYEMKNYTAYQKIRKIGKKYA